jgi:hypothetical protein
MMIKLAPETPDGNKEGAKEGETGPSPVGGKDE